MTTAELSLERSSSRDRATGVVSQAVLDDAPLLILVACFIGGVALSSVLTGLPASISWGASFRLVGPFALLYAVGAMIFAPIHAVLLKRRSLRRWDTYGDMARTLWSPRRVLGFALVFVVLCLFMPAFLAVKLAIPQLHPFSWDGAFMEWDRFLHFGRHPYEWLLPLLGQRAVTRIIDYVYFLWIPLMWFTAIWQAWHGSRETVHRSQFLLAFVLCWIVLGTFGAIWLSSAGPAFFAAVTGEPDPYTPLLAHLQETNAVLELRAIWLQDFLWTAYTSPDAAPLGGISAMPSLHVSIAVLMVLLGFRVKRWLGLFYLAFALAIFIGSIHLAWHYAIDGYVGAVGTILIWRASGSVMRWWRARLPWHADEAIAR